MAFWSRQSIANANIFNKQEVLNSNEKVAKDKKICKN